MYIIMKDVTKTAILFSTVANALFSLEKSGEGGVLG